MSDAAQRQKETVAACRAAMPAALAALWDTVTHAPNVAFEPVVEALRAGFPEEAQRMRAVLGWYGHGDGTCPVCHMLVGKLVYAVSDPIARLADVVAEGDADVVKGACLFLSSQLERRHARAAGVSAERLEAMRAEVGALSADLRARLAQGGFSPPAGSTG